MTAPIDRLTRQDEGYLLREREVQPMHFVVLLLADPAAGGPVTVDAVRAQVEARLHTVPGLRRRIRRAPFGIGPTVWVDDPLFRVDRQVVPWPTSARTETDLAAALADESLRRLPRDRPLWRLAVAPPLADGRIPVAFSIHHAFMDGGLFRLALDGLCGPDRPEPPEQPEPWRPARAPAALRLLALGVAARLRARLAPTAPAPAPGGAAQPVGGLLTGTVGPRRAVALRTLALEAVRDLRRCTEATLNDLYLALVTDGLRDLLTARGESTRPVIGDRAP